MSTLRADLHVHSCFSRQSGNMKFLKSRDCYSSPDAVYRTARARGMDLVTITDHDSIDGCLDFLARHPDAADRDFIIGEEVSCRFPGTDIEVHFGVYGITEALHRELQPLRRDAFEVAACLRDAGVFFALNHLLHFYRGQVPLDDYLRLLAEVPALEARNGTMLAAHNGLIEGLAHAAVGVTPARRLSVTGGSDAHTLRRIGTTWTAAAGTTPAEFLASLRAGQAAVGGAHGSATAIAADAYGVILAYIASLAGFGPRDHTLTHRALCLAFSAVTLPAQFLPLALAWNGKRHEARQVRHLAAAAAGRRLEAAGEVGA
jgi:predicted metal-dependent phosphoesterase TrpH